IYTVAHADYTPASAARPLERDQVALIYATGLGPVANQPSTGAASPALALASTETPARVSLAGVRCPVEYSGLTPGLAGVYQVNFRVPSDSPGGWVDVVLEAGAERSPAAKVWVQ
ncbi:MAG: hypothetical protein ACRD96_20930, partial [Bryobacteraceae bacterium]